MAKEEIAPKPGDINEKSGLRQFTTDQETDAVKRSAKTGQDTHRATMRGYAIPVTFDKDGERVSAPGQLIEEGEIVPANVPISTEWMEEVDRTSRALVGAIQEAQADHPGDVDLTQLSKSALEAMAAERGINVAGLSKNDLIAAIKAEREPTI